MGVWLRGTLQWEILKLSKLSLLQNFPNYSSMMKAARVFPRCVHVFLRTTSFPKQSLRHTHSVNTTDHILVLFRGLFRGLHLCHVCFNYIQVINGVIDLMHSLSLFQFLSH